jgi:hypothetical protein
MEGMLRKKGAINPSYKERWFVLWVDDTSVTKLCYFEQKNGKLLGKIDLRHCPPGTAAQRCRISDSDPCQIELATDRRTWKFRVPNSPVSTLSVCACVSGGGW